jgi:tetratricopeptide (TPR) repeat protein
MIAGTLSTHYRAAGNASRAAHYADRAAEQALTMAAWAEAAGWYEKAYACEPTPQRQLSLGRAQFWQGHLDQARTAFHAAREAFHHQENWRGAGHACLDLAGTYMSLGRADEVMYWVECATTYLEREDDPATRAWAHFLLGSAQRDSAPVLDSAEDHLEKAVQLAIKHGLPEVRSRSLVIIGDVYLQRGDLLQARFAFQNAIEQAQLAQDPLQEALAHNEVARLSILTGNLEVAHQHLAAGQAIIETYALQLPRAYLYVTRGELALVEEQWNSAEAWLNDGRAAAEQHHQPLQAASAQASLGRVAWGRGELDQAIWHLEAARAEAIPLAARRLQTQIDLWLAEVYSLRGERLAAEEALSRAEERLANSTDNLWAWVARIRQKVGIDRIV